MSDAAARLPNLYQLLGLAPLETDRAKIAQAIKRVQTADGQEPAAAAEDRERMQKIAALAQKYLLDPQRKLAYDQQWKAVYQTSPSAGDGAVAAVSNKASVTAAVAKAAVATSPSAASWDYRRLDQLLPQGDPQAAFDMASFLSSGGGESRDPLAAQADLSKLIALLSDAIVTSHQSANAASPMVIGSTALGIEQRPDYDESHEHSLGLPPSSPEGQLHAPGGVLARRMRQRKQRALLVGGAALAGGLGGLVLLGVYLFAPKGTSPQTQLAQAGQARPAPVRGSGLPKVGLANGAAATDVAQKGPPAAAPVGSGLPKPGEGAINLQVDPAAVPAAMPEAMPAPDAMAQAAAPPTVTPDLPNGIPSTTPAPGSQPVPEGEPKPTMETPPVGEAKPAGEPLPESTTEPPAAPAAEPELSDAEKRMWKQHMLEAKELIGKQDFAGAEKQLAELQPAAKTSQQRGQLARLEQVLGFIKDIHQAIVAAIAGLGPADTFPVGGSTVASFVEGNDERITVRVGGRNRAYKLNELPVNLGLGLVDLKLDIEHASSLARKGAYILTHPKGDAAIKRGQRMLQQAADAGAISPELAKFYEDDYSLSSEAN